MPRTVDPGWIEEFELGTVGLLLYLNITRNDIELRDFISGNKPLFGARMGLAGARLTPAQLDVLMRYTTVGQLTTTLVDDDVLREFIAETTPIIGSRLQLRWGTEDITIGQFTNIVNNYMVTEIKPERGSINLIANDPAVYPLEQELGLYREPGHPLKVKLDILELLIDSSLIDTTTFDSKLYTTKSHHVVCTQVFGFEGAASSADWLKTRERLEEPTYYTDSFGGSLSLVQSGKRAKAIDIIQDLTFVTRGSTSPNDDGLWGYVDYDRTGTSVRDLSRDEVSDFEQLDTYEKILNRVFVTGYGAYDLDDMPYVSADDTTAQSDFGFIPPSAPKVDRIEEETFRSNFFQQFVRLDQVSSSPSGAFDAVNTSLEINSPLYHGFVGTYQEDASGNRVFPPDTTQQTEHQLNGSTRVGWFLITNHLSGSNARREIVRATAMSFVNQPWNFGTVRTPRGDRNFWRQAVYTVDRADGSSTYFGTNALNWTQSAGAGQGTRIFFVYDITTARFVLESILDRFSRGVPIVQFTTTSRHNDLERGEFFSLVSDVFLRDGSNGASVTTIFELLRQEPNGRGTIKITAAFVRQGAVPPAVTATFDTPDPNDGIIQQPDNFLLGTIGTDIIDIFDNSGSKMRVK